MNRRRKVAACLEMALILGALTACGAGRAGVADGGSAFAAGPGAAAADSLRGTLAVVGAEPLTRVVVQTRDGDQVVLTGEALPSLRRLDGIEVLCRGDVAGGRLRVTAFNVVGAHGLPARDGTLEIRDQAAVLTRPAGAATPYEPVPAALRQWVGHRVWIAGVPGGAPQAWGVISPPR